MSIIITGASRGIGKAIAMKFAQEGYGLVLISKNEERLLQCKSDIQSSFPMADIKVIPANLKDKTDINRLGAEIIGLNTEIKALINNAGTFVPGEMIQEDDEVLEELIETNLYSAYRLTKRVLPRFLEQGSGHIFNMCSVASINAYPNGGAYAISKHALIGFSKCLREELKGKGVKVTSVLPGATYTDSWDGSDLPESRFCQASDIADVVFNAFNLSDSAVVEEVTIRPQLGDI